MNAHSIFADLGVDSDVDDEQDEMPTEQPTAEFGVYPDEETTLVEVKPVDEMYWFRFSNGMWIVMGMGKEVVPPVGTKMIMVYPNDTEIWVHWPYMWRSHPLHFHRDAFCVW